MVILGHETNQVEQAYMGPGSPAGAREGEVIEACTPYRLALPEVGTEHRVGEAAEQVARTSGLGEVRGASTGSEAVIEGQRPIAGVRLLPLMRSLTPLQPRVAVIGVGENGHPVLLSLAAGSTWHVLVVGPSGAGKSELLRSLALSLAMTTRPAQLRMFAVDVGGRQMAVLESLPHLAADLASDEVSGARLVAWLAAQAEIRLEGRGRGAEWVLLLDDLSWLQTPDHELTRNALDFLLASGLDTRIHVIAACSSAGMTPLCLHFPAGRFLEAEGLAARVPGKFRLTAANDDLVMRAAWLPLMDLDRAVRWISAGWCAG